MIKVRIADDNGELVAWINPQFIMRVLPLQDIIGQCILEMAGVPNMVVNESVNSMFHRLSSGAGVSVVKIERYDGTEEIVALKFVIGVLPRLDDRTGREVIGESVIIMTHVRVELGESVSSLTGRMAIAGGWIPDVEGGKKPS